jgi:hypothetical protein
VLHFEAVLHIWLGAGGIQDIMGFLKEDD